MTLVDDNGAHVMDATTFAGLPANSGNAHRLVNRSSRTVKLLVVGSRRPGLETIHYPDDDLGPVRR